MLNAYISSLMFNKYKYLCYSMYKNLQEIVL